MKDSQLVELYFVAKSPSRYYIFVLLSMFGGWNIAQDIMNILEHKMNPSSIAFEYIAITMLSMLGFYFVRKNALRKIRKLEKENVS
ncbi:hypothetical protein [Sulfurospirillum sp. 1612]|uniref:hypothetical protein n=1 Tax=Sulfurospirillum sp. 1612 TaxID=3094835 RepID=UPI002F95E2DB